MSRHLVDQGIDQPQHDRGLFENFRISADGSTGKEGRGLRYILDGMNAEPILVAAEAFGDGRWFVKRPPNT